MDIDLNKFSLDPDEFGPQYVHPRECYEELLTELFRGRKAIDVYFGDISISVIVMWRAGNRAVELRRWIKTRDPHTGNLDLDSNVLWTGDACSWTELVALTRESIKLQVIQDVLNI